jgi:hypothetical protein
MFFTPVYSDGRLCISILHPPGDDPVSGEKAEVKICDVFSRRIDHPFVMPQMTTFRNDGTQHNPWRVRYLFRLLFCATSAAL